MATLINHTDADQYCVALHVMVPANGSVDIPDADVDKVNTATGVFGATRAETQVSERRQVTRGGKPVEITAAPPMETR